MAARTESFENARKEGVIQATPMIASEIIYKGAQVLVASATGLAFTNDGTTNTLANGDIFGGIAVETVDNSGGAASDKDVRAYRKGSFLMPFSDTLTQANVGDKVYINNVTDDSVVTVTSDTGNPQITIGEIVEFVSANRAYVAIDNYVGNVAAAGA
jgi:hypothetical protein